jgi:hypothetical protein
MNRRVIGLGLAGIGGGLVFYGLKAADALGSRVTELWTGRPSDEALAFLIGGAVLVVVGLGVALRGGGKKA